MPLPTPPAESAGLIFPIVGLGASAGGLEALEQFLKAVPEKSGLAFVIVQHLDPEHECIM
ncbi:MAG: chemotaxis protein CheB, partial [Verrucomicrobiota bacterium]